MYIVKSCYSETYDALGLETRDIVFSDIVYSDTVFYYTETLK